MAEVPGPLRLCIYHGTWASRDGVLKPPLDAYATLDGGLDVQVIRWGDESIDDGLAALARLAPAHPLIAAERARLAAPRALPPGFEPLWFVGALPSRVGEDSFATHDYASIALEVDDGRALTWYWSAALPAEHHYGCPLPRWKGIETHLVVRSGAAGLGTWIDERRDVQADVTRALGAGPARIVAVWLIAVSLFQRGVASADVRRIALVQDGQRHTVFP